ncbi:MAG: MOSC domain-containing protein [Vicinamibacteria bacterium]
MPEDQPSPDPVLGATQGRLNSIQISNGGVPKRRLEGPVLVSGQGVAGDRQRNLHFHGGPDRAVCLFSQELIDDLHDKGHPIAPGTAGENLTISGLDWRQVQTGARLIIGSLVLEITQPAHPCKTIIGSFLDGDFSRLSAKLYPGRGRMYARVLVAAEVRPGDSVTLEAIGSGSAS